MFYSYINTYVGMKLTAASCGVSSNLKKTLAVWNGVSFRILRLCSVQAPEEAQSDCFVPFDFAQGSSQWQQKTCSMLQGIIKSKF